MTTRAAGNLPADLTSFVGRRDELTRAKNLLAVTRLMTLTGMGGIGKTRFGRQLASEVRRNFPDGAWLVELADLRQGTLLAQTIGRTLGIRDESSDPVGHLVDHIRDQRLVLVLDNCEHLAESCAVLVGKLLQAAPMLRIIATSRHVLGVEGEQVFPVTALTNEPSEDGPTEAMELFEERASAADPNFRITEDNREAVAAICQQLEGLPLAVELASANIRMFSPAEILGRLQGAEVLSTAERTRPSRHRTLQAAIEWSDQLCTFEERRTWEQLSVFSGGFTVGAAEAVCIDGDRESTTVAALMGLVDKSIVTRVHGTQGGSARYRMLETVREYAAEKLESSPEAHSVRRRHRDYFRQLALRSRSDYCSSRDTEWYATTRTEHANMRAALEFSLSSPQEYETALEMGTLLRPFWEHSGSVLEGYRWLKRGLREYRAPSRHRAAAQLAASILGFLIDDTENARRLLDEHLSLAARAGYDEFRAVASFSNALASFAAGDREKAFGHAQESVELGLDTNDPGAVAEAMALSAFCAFLIEDDHSEEVAERFVQYAEGHGAHLLKAVALFPLGAVRWRKSDVMSATTLMREAIRLYELFEHPGMVAVCVEGLAWCAADDEPERAATLLGAAKSIWKYSQMRLPEIATRDVSSAVESRLRRELGDMGFEQALSTGGELTFEQAVALALGSPARRRAAKSKDGASRAGLTRREQEIAALVAEGLTNKEIAAKLVISHRTADAHVEHILAKLGFRSRAQIARWFSQQAD